MGTRDRPVVYEPHPVTPARKQELRALGFNIVDSKFAPPAARQDSIAPAAKARKPRKSTEGVE
jgi:hypothetical protein